MAGPSVVFYISGHGLGHSVRSCEVLNALHDLVPDLAFEIRSNAPRWVFAANLRCPFEYGFLDIDVGAVPKTPFTVDKPRTLRACQQLYERQSRLVRDEVEFLRGKKVALILSDIPPLAFDVAWRAGVPGVGIANFSWDWIYAAYAKEYPKFGELLERIRESQSKAACLLRLPLGGGSSNFPRERRIPLVARRTAKSRTEIRSALGLGRETKQKLVLLAFGGMDGAGFLQEGIRRSPKYLFMVPTEQPLPRLANLVKPPGPPGLSFQDLVKGSDLVLSKPGYGIVSDCIANKTPLMYTSREDFAEYPVLVKQMKRYLPSCLIPRLYLVMGDWEIHLDGFFESGMTWRDCPTDGAAQAARILEKYIK